MNYWLPLDLSADTLTQTTAGSTTSAWKVLPENTVARSAQFSKSVIPTVAEAARTPRTFPDGMRTRNIYYSFYPLSISTRVLTSHSVRSNRLEVIYDYISVRNTMLVAHTSHIVGYSAVIYIRT